MGRKRRTWSEGGGGELSCGGSLREASRCILGLGVLWPISDSCLGFISSRGEIWIFSFRKFRLSKPSQIRRSPNVLKNMYLLKFAEKRLFFTKTSLMIQWVDRQGGGPTLHSMCIHVRHSGDYWCPCIFQVCFKYSDVFFRNLWNRPRKRRRF